MRYVDAPLQVRMFRVPGWNQTSESEQTPQYPGHTSVNHAKYIVTDRRINIGTSNITRDYFVGTAGTSFNATHTFLVRRLQDIFDRDWSSRYSAPLEHDSP